MWVDFPSRPQEDAVPPPPASIWDYFSELPDPRRSQGRRHKFRDILAISLCTVLCGADDFTEIEEFGETRVVPITAALKRSGVGRGVGSAGLEFEYEGEAGSVVMSAVS